ncbi:endoplasmic reticulum-Golgi intermediate compartment protein 3-like [Gymnogyps californianus]|uniref:endoplasmic reticulum-Golgi intermediate compartment protein 3-like n=1 Tax=Gymnogyps californianus TaxID=33616 RepID=UPI0021C98D30|nr:endoplasmic reticulum-Golgi intermediate compartment protein 3-like [Gymnogyps californianus]XP_050770181.1 endoplasmic reticulum-Golgi intermediate compartment protein 3-like [Gymnogyps californianus]XP_050770557.1 endoplasmic reticulum-Golgi intermediate compartment protein 3-like [Gymnogyps californianus]
MASLWRLKRFDAFPKPLEDFRVKTCGGALELGKEEVFDPNSLDADGCESCCGAESEDVRCCNSCGDAREAYRRRGWAFKNPDSIEQRKREGFSQKMQEQKKEGCQVYGFLEVSKVAGNFHFAPGKSFQQSRVHGIFFCCLLWP